MAGPPAAARPVDRPERSKGPVAPPAARWRQMHAAGNPVAVCAGRRCPEMPTSPKPNQPNRSKNGFGLAWLQPSAAGGCNHSAAWRTPRAAESHGFASRPRGRFALIEIAWSGASCGTCRLTAPRPPRSSSQHNPRSDFARVKSTPRFNAQKVPRPQVAICILQFAFFMLQCPPSPASHG